MQIYAKTATLGAVGPQARCSRIGRTGNGRKFRTLNAIDEAHRELLRVGVGISIPSVRPNCALDQGSIGIARLSRSIKTPTLSVSPARTA